MFDVTIRHQPARRLAALAHTGAYTGIGACFQRLADMAASRNLWPGTTGMAAVYYDDPETVPTDELCAHAGLVLRDDAPLPDGLRAVTLAAGPHAVLRYQGPYDRIGAAYRHLTGTWLPGSGHAASGAPCYELYINSPGNTGPEDLLTDICLPLQD